MKTNANGNLAAARGLHSFGTINIVVMPGGAKRRVKFGLPPRSALFQNLFLAVTWVFLNLLSQFKKPLVALDEAHNISKNHSKRFNPQEVTAIFSLHTIS